MNNVGIKARLKQARSELGLSQTAFAAELGLPFRTYQGYEGGERDISVGLLDALFEKFDLNPLWILRGDSAPKHGGTLDVRLAKQVIFGLAQRWESYPVKLTPAEIADDFERVYKYFLNRQFDEAVLDVAVRRVG